MSRSRTSIRHIVVAQPEVVADLVDDGFADLAPGLLGMNLMGTGMWGIGFSLVVARNGNCSCGIPISPMRSISTDAGAANSMRTRVNSFRRHSDVRGGNSR